MAACGAMAAVGSSFAVLDGLRDYPAAGGQAMRYAVGAALLAALARGRIGRPSRTELVRLALLAATGLAAFNVLVLVAEDSMDPGSVGVVVATVPVLLALAGPLQAGRRPQARLVAAGAIVAAGAAAILVPTHPGGDISATGLAAALGALACEAAFSLLAAPLLGSLGPIGVSAWAAGLAVPMLALLAIPTGGVRTPTATEAACLAWLAVVISGAFVLWYSAIRALGVERTGLFAGVLPVAALFCAAALGGSALTPGRVAGVLAVAAGIAAGLSVGRRASRAVAATA